VGVLRLHKLLSTTLTERTSAGEVRQDEAKFKRRKMVKQVASGDANNRPLTLSASPVALPLCKELRLQRRHRL